MGKGLVWKGRAKTAVEMTARARDVGLCRWRIDDLDGYCVEQSCEFRTM